MIPMHLAHDSAVLRTLPLSWSLNRWICGSLTLAQICPYGQTSHIPGTLGDIVLEGGMINGRRTLPTIYEMSNKSN